MRITKLEHAALIIENDGKTLVIDPGKFTRAVQAGTAVVAVVITHEHDDHWTPSQLEGIRAANPHVRFFGPAGVVTAAKAADIAVAQVSAGDKLELDGFTVEFFGGTHAVIHRSIPVIDNVGVLVNDRFFYGGDAFVAPRGIAIEVLAVPASAPWMKISEAMDYVEQLAPAHTFTTHEMLLSDAGKALSNARIGATTEQGGGRFTALEPGETLDF